MKGNIVMETFTCFGLMVVLLACTTTSAFASSPLTKGGVVKSVDLETRVVNVSGAIMLGYDFQGLPGKPGELGLKYQSHTLFLLDGVPTPPAQALKPGNLLKRAWLKHGGSMELFSANSPLLESRNATISLSGAIMEKDGKPDYDHFLALRIECKEGKFARVYGVLFGGCHPSLYGPEVAVDAGGLKFEEGKLKGTVKIASTPPTQLELDVKAEGAAMRGGFSGKQGEQKVSGYFNGEFDYPETDAPAVASFMLKPGWDGGTNTTPPVLVSVSYKGAATGIVTMTPYNGKAQLDLQVEKMALRLYPAIGGSFTFKVDSDTYKSGVYTFSLMGQGGEQMGLGGAVGTGSVTLPCEVTKDGQSVSKGLAEFVVRNARRLMPKQ